MEASAWVLFCGEECRITIKPSFEARSVQVDGEEIPQRDGQYELVYRDTGRCGEKIFQICVDGIHTWCRVLVTEQPEELVRRRCLFIARHQQYGGHQQSAEDWHCAGHQRYEEIPGTGDGMHSGRAENTGGNARKGGHGGSLEGAYLAYDNEEEHMYYDRNNDYNGGRERVGMGILMAEYMQLRKSEAGGSLPAEGGE